MSAAKKKENIGKIRELTRQLPTFGTRTVLTKALSGGKVLYLMNPPNEQSEDMFAETEKVIKAYKTAIENSRLGKLVVLSSIGAHLPSGTGPSVTDHLVEQATALAASLVIGGNWFILIGGLVGSLTGAFLNRQEAIRDERSNFDNRFDGGGDNHDTI